MKSKAFALAGLVASLTFGPAHAEAGITASAGTTGAGLHLSVEVAERMNARFGLNGLSYSRDGNTNNVDYDFRLKMATVDALVDYFPTDGGFRFSGGVVYDGNKIDANGRPANGTYSLNGHLYPAAAVGSLNGQIEFRKAAPYLGIGWGNAVSKEKGWGFSSDIGVLFQGTPQSALINRGCTATSSVCTQIAADVAVENRSLQDEVSKFKAFPVLRVGVSYMF